MNLHWRQTSCRCSPRPSPPPWRLSPSRGGPERGARGRPALSLRRPRLLPRARYYNNGRWIDEGAWEAQREREWRRNQYRRYRNNDSGDALAAGIIGFALGAAILGSQNDASRAYGYRGDNGHVARCRARYRSYDSRSDTFMGNNGYRRYCVL